jgi:hypothetical protein
MTDYEDDPELQELRDQTEKDNRLSDADQQPAFVERLIDSFDAVEDGEGAKTLSFHDPRMAALVTALDEDQDRLRESVAALQSQLDRQVDADNPDRSQFFRLAVRAGLQAADSELLADAKEAHSQRQRQQF